MIAMARWMAIELLCDCVPIADVWRGHAWGGMHACREMTRDDEPACRAVSGAPLEGVTAAGLAAARPWVRASCRSHVRCGAWGGESLAGAALCRRHRASLALSAVHQGACAFFCTFASVSA